MKYAQMKLLPSTVLLRLFDLTYIGTKSCHTIRLPHSHKFFDRDLRISQRICSLFKGNQPPKKSLKQIFAMDILACPRPRPNHPLLLSIQQAGPTGKIRFPTISPFLEKHRDNDIQLKRKKLVFLRWMPHISALQGAGLPFLASRYTCHMSARTCLSDLLSNLLNVVESLPRCSIGDFSRQGSVLSGKEARKKPAQKPQKQNL